LPDDTAQQVSDKVTVAAEICLDGVLPALLAGTARRYVNDLAHGSYYGGRTPDDGRIDWSKSAREIHNLVRAVAPPYPGAFTDDLKILKTKIEPLMRAPGRVLGPYRQDGQWYAACGDGGVLRLVEVEPAK